MNFIPTTILAKFRNLKYLLLKGVSLLALNEHLLDNCGRLMSLDLESNELHGLRSGICRICANLQTLRRIKSQTLNISHLMFLKNSLFGPSEKLFCGIFCDNFIHDALAT